MNREQRERLVDSALDRALGPQAVEPRTGLEERMLANLQTQPAPRRWWQWMWIPALAAAAVLAVVIGIRLMHREAPATQVMRRQVPPTDGVDVRASTQPEPRVHVKARVRNLPRATTGEAVSVNRNSPGRPFAPATKLTPAERALVAMLRRNSDEAELLLQRQQQARQESDEFLRAFDQN